MEDKIIFVYNKDSGVINLFKNFFHKTFKTRAYSCNLSMLTYDSFKMKKEWENFIKNLGNKIVFLHKDEFIEEHKSKEFKLPAIFKQKKNLLIQLISSTELNSFKNLKELINALKKKL